jgi:hypothetical protein
VKPAMLIFLALAIAGCGGGGSDGGPAIKEKPSGTEGFKVKAVPLGKDGKPIKGDAKPK